MLLPIYKTVMHHRVLAEYIYNNNSNHAMWIPRNLCEKIQTYIMLNSRLKLGTVAIAYSKTGAIRMCLTLPNLFQMPKFILICNWESSIIVCPPSSCFLLTLGEGVRYSIIWFLQVALQCLGPQKVK